MGKKIGVKITVMMVILTIMYLITSFASGYAQEQALGGLNRVYNNWVQLERYETKLVKVTDNCTFYANMIVHYKMPAAQQQLAEGMPAMIEETQGYFKQMHSLVDALEPNDLVGVAKEDVKAALTAYEAAVTVVQDQAATVASLYLAGDEEASKNANNGASANIQALSEAEAAFMALVSTAADNLIVQRNETVNGFSSISDVMFFVFLGAAALMIFYINKTVANPAKNVQIFKRSNPWNQITDSTNNVTSAIPKDKK